MLCTVSNNVERLGILETPDVLEDMCGYVCVYVSVCVHFIFIFHLIHFSIVFTVCQVVSED